MQTFDISYKRVYRQKFNVSNFTKQWLRSSVKMCYTILVNRSSSEYSDTSTKLVYSC